MKKILTFLIISVLSIMTLSLSSCGEDSSGETKEPSLDNSSEQEVVSGSKLKATGGEVETIGGTENTTSVESGINFNN